MNKTMTRRKLTGKTGVKLLLAAGLLVHIGIGATGETADAAAAKAASPTTAPVPANKPSPAPAPIMRDNLSKYGLKKEVELPVTVEAGGLSYTLEKIMIYETKSETAQALIKKYGYTGTEDQKYFIWTKITFENKSGSLVQFGSRDLSQKWRLYFNDDSRAYTNMPAKNADLVNNKDSLWTWKLKPGEKLSSYQALIYNGQLDTFFVLVENKGKSYAVDVVLEK